MLRIKLRYDDLEAMVQRFAANVGKSGLFLPTRSMQPVGAEVKFELRLADDTPALVGLGRVKAVKPPDPHNPKATFGMTVELMRVTPQSRALILRMLERRRALGLPEVGLPTAADIDAVRRAEPGDAGRDLGTGPVVLVAPPALAPVPPAPAPVPAVVAGPVPAVAAGPVPAVAPGPVPAVAAGPVPAVAAGPVPAVGEGLLTAPRRTTGPIAVAKVAAIAPLPPEPPRRPRAPVSEVLERASGPIVGLAAAAPGLDDDVDLAAAIARARALAGGALDAELEALCEAAAAPLEISVEVASAELARQLGGSAVRRDRSAGWAPPPATSVESPDAARSNGAASNGAARAPAIDDAAPVAAAEHPGQDAAPAADDERVADDAAPVAAAERPGQDAAPAAAERAADDAAPVAAAERPGQDAAPAAADDAAPVAAAERPGQDAAPAAADERAADDAAPVAAGPEDGAAASLEAAAEWSAAAETSPAAPAAAGAAGDEIAAPPVAVAEADAPSGAAEMEGDAPSRDTPVDLDPAPGLAAIEVPDASRSTGAIDERDDDDRGAPARLFGLPHIERIGTEPSAPVGVVFPAEGRAELALADLDSDEHTELGERPVAPGGFDPPADPDDHAAAEAELAAGFAPAAEPPLELGVDEFDDFEIIAEANADDEDLLASHGEHDASSRRELAARPETGERRPSELDVAARLELGEDGDLYLGASADELSAGRVIDNLQDEQTSQHPVHRERFAPAPSDPRAISVGAALAALEADDEVGDDAFDDAEVTEGLDAYAQRIVRPIFDPDPSSSFTLAGVPSDSIDVDIPAPRRPGPSEPPPPAHRAEPIESPRPARRHAPLSLHEAPVEDHELEHALEALDVDLDDLAIPHAAPQRQREPSRSTPQVRSQLASRTPAPGVRAAAPVPASPRAARPTPAPPRAVRPTPAPPRAAHPTPAPPRAVKPTPAPPRVAASTPSRAVPPTGLGAPGSGRIGSPRVPSEGVDIDFDDDD